MAKKTQSNKVQTKPIKDCETQLESLYTYLGRFIYKNMEDEKLFYRFEPENSQCEDEARQLLGKVKYFQAPREPKTASSKSADHRGRLEPYTSLVISTNEIIKKLASLKKDINHCLSAAISGFEIIDNTHTGESVVQLNVVFDRISSMLENEMEVIKDMMTKKKKNIEKNAKDSGLEISKEEKKFLKNAEDDLANVAGNIDKLAKQAVKLFRDIKESYEKDIEAWKETLEIRRQETGAAGEEIFVAKDTGAPDQAEWEEARMDEGPEEDVPSVDEEPGPEEEVKEEITSEDEDAEAAQEIEGSEKSPELFHEDLFETARRKLRMEDESEGENLKVLNTLLRYAPGRVPDFLAGVIREGDFDFKKKIVHLLSKIENKEVVPVYRSFLSDDEPYLRLNGIIGLNRWKPGEGRDAMILSVGDPNSGVRRFVVNCLDPFRSDAEAAGIARLSNDRDENVARIAIRKLGMARNRFAFVNLVHKLESPSTKVRKEAINALQSMTGLTLGYKYLAPDKERTQSYQKWKNLWEQNRNNPHFLDELRSGLLTSEKSSSAKNRKNNGRSARSSRRATMRPGAQR